MSDRFVRQARNEALFREVNERIAELGETAGHSTTDKIELLCECGVEGGAANAS